MAPNERAACPFQEDETSHPGSGILEAPTAVCGITELRKPIEWASKNWLLLEPEDIHRSVLTTLTDKPWLHRKSDAETFSKRMLKTLVYTSNALENTLPAGVKQQQTYCIIDDIATSDRDTSMCDEPSTTWSADGDIKGQISRAQLVQHMRAAKFLFGFVDKPLTVDIIKQTHKLLMAGAIDEDNVRIKAGEFRDHPSHAGMHAYPEGDPEKLQSALTDIVDKFNDSISVCDDNTLITVPACLFYDTITLHPFQNGNGRLCRLLFAFAVSKAGVPFPVQLTTGHSKARKHYMRAILRARRGKRDELYTMTLMSISNALCSFENFRPTSSACNNNGSHVTESRTNCEVSLLERHSVKIWSESFAMDACRQGANESLFSNFRNANAIAVPLSC